MLEELKPILEIQELDMQMIRLLRLKKERKKELDNLNKIRSGLDKQVKIKEGEITEMKKNIRLQEMELKEIEANIKRLEGQQHAIKKVEEFNALTHEISQAEKERHGKEQRLSDLYDKLAEEEEVLKNLRGSFEETVENSQALEQEIKDSITQINEEGSTVKKERDVKVKDADSDVFAIYERLLRNKQDRVIVPIENRCCSGCHILLTAQDENLVRKGERLVFCEHCSRIHYWQESEALEGTPVATKKRRRRATATS